MMATSSTSDYDDEVIIIEEDADDESHGPVGETVVMPVLERELPSSSVSDLLVTIQSSITSIMPKSTSTSKSSLSDISNSEYRFCVGCDVKYFEQTTSYTCSYASVQMIVSSLLSIHDPAYRKSLFNGAAFVPNVRSVQALIEVAWKQGFDVEGASQFGNKLVGKPRRIGASDIAALLRANRVPTRIFDFDHGRLSWPTVERFCYEYFFPTPPNRRRHAGSVLFPLLLGYAEHTVVVVGCARRKRGERDEQIDLIVFDPATGVRRARDAARSRLELFYAKRGYLASFKQFQILAFGPFEDHEGFLINKDSPVSVASKTLYAIRPSAVKGEISKT